MLYGLKNYCLLVSSLLTQALPPMCPTQSMKKTSIAYPTSPVNWQALQPAPLQYSRIDPSRLNRWMSSSNQLQALSLKEITLPGAHDAGMGIVSQCSDFANAAVTQTQKTSFQTMLENGIRYFDVRPMISRTNEMMLGHYRWVGRQVGLGVKTFNLHNEGCLGYSLESMLMDVKRFLNKGLMAGDREIIFLKMSHFMNFYKYNHDQSFFDADDVKRLQHEIKNELKPYLVNKNDFLTTPLKALTATGPKVIVTLDTNEPLEAGFHAEHNIDIYDEYSNTPLFNKMKKDQFNKIWLSADKHYSVLSWTLTQSEPMAVGCVLPRSLGYIAGYKCQSIESLSQASQQGLATLADELDHIKTYPNVLYTDFTGKQETQVAIDINERRLG